MEYSGFYIDNKCGNNKFSYEIRQNKKIYVAPIKELPFEKNTILSSLISSDKIAFSEYDEECSIEKNIFGIQNFLLTKSDDKKIHIFDNHNHCFYFVANETINDIKKINNTSTNILKNYLNGETKKPKLKTMIHFDQHKDMRKPDVSLYDYMQNSFYKKYSNFDIATDIDYISYYTNYILNVGNFIVPLIDNSFIKDVIIIDSTYSMQDLEKNIDNYEDVILDIDLDFFSEEMDYIDNEFKIKLIKRCYDVSSILTICTSPYFIEFKRAKNFLEKILDKCM